MDDIDSMTIPIDHKSPPTTVREVGIHLIYMSRNMADIARKIEEMNGMYARRQELLDAITQRKADQQEICKDAQALDVRVTKLEDSKSKIIGWVAGAFIIMLIVLVLAQYGLDRYFKV